jgi:hypothetical protein
MRLASPIAEITRHEIDRSSLWPPCGSLFNGRSAMGKSLILPPSSIATACANVHHDIWVSVPCITAELQDGESLGPWSI